MDFEITDVLKDFRTLNREDYRARHPEAVFIHRTNSGDGYGNKSFYVGLEQSNQGPRATMVSFDPAQEIQTSRSKSGVLIFPIAPLEASPTMSRVRVGRGIENDIRLPYDGVSKEHAHITWKPDRSEFYVTDLGTTNGTFVNGVELTPRKPKRMLTGSIIKFGTAELNFREADDFYDYLLNLLPKR